jgi:hypothetical protein
VVHHHHHNTDEHATASMSATTPTTLIDNPPTLAATSQPQPSCRPADPVFHDDKQISKLASMLGGMTRITVTMDDRLAAAVRATAGHNVSGWLAALVRHKLLEQAVAAEIACDQQHPDYQVWCDERLDEIEEARA